MSEWQPIETAPKDGTWVLLFVERYGAKYWLAGHWFSGSDGSCGWVSASFYAEPHVNWTTCSDPTHWMPLPDPPVVGYHDDQPVSEALKDGTER